MLGAVDLSSPLLWAVLVGWIMTVVLHEFAHGVIAYWGGDYTIRERGGLTLNPLQYVDPVMSIILPAVFLLMGGIPLPGGATYIRRDLLKNRFWESAVAAGGPVMNFLLFLGLGYAVDPRFGWVAEAQPVAQWTNAQLFVAAMALLQLFAMLLNLLPVPPLDGFQIISPFLPPATRDALQQPRVALGLFLALFVLLSTGGLFQVFLSLMERICDGLGMDYIGMIRAMRLALWGNAS